MPITEYIVKKYKSVPCDYLEADDWCTISSIESKDRVQVSADKDSLGCLHQQNRNLVCEMVEVLAAS